MDEVTINKRLAKYDAKIRQYPEFYNVISSYEDTYSLDISQRLYLRVFVPALTGYMEWVIQDALKSNIKRLYFLSRDGYQMYLAGRHICESRQLDIECRYINVSRYSMRMPAYHLDLEKSIDQICVGGIDITLTKILKRAALTEEEASQVIEGIGWTDRRDEILNYGQIMKLKSELKAARHVYKYIDKHSRECYGDAIGYLNQEGLLDDIKCAVVDSGWIGTLQDTMEMLMQSVNERLSLEGYYFGMYEIPKGCDGKKYHAYYFGPDWGMGKKVRFSNSLFETIISADEGMALGYEKSGTGYLVIRDDTGNPNREQMLENIGVLEQFLLQYKVGCTGDHTINKLREITEDVMKLFMAEPTMIEVDAYGDNRFSADLLEGTQKKVAAELTFEQIKDQWFVNKLLIMKGLKKATIYESAWLEGSAVRCGIRVKNNLMHIRWYKYFVYLRKGLRRS